MPQLFRFGPNKQGDTSKLDSKSIYASGSDSDDASKVLSTTDKAMTPPYGRSRSSKNDRQAVIKSGYLKKQGAKMKNWSERWFVLQSDSLHYYKERDGKYLVSLQLKLKLTCTKLFSSFFAFKVFPITSW